MFGVALAFALLGLALSWRRRSAWLLALLWLGGAALALGPVLWIGGHAYVPAAQMLHGVRVSPVMPYTWFVQFPRALRLPRSGAARQTGPPARGAARRGNSRLAALPRRSSPRRGRRRRVSGSWLAR